MGTKVWNNYLLDKGFANITKKFCQFLAKRGMQGVHQSLVDIKC